MRVDVFFLLLLSPLSLSAALLCRQFITFMTNSHHKKVVLLLCMCLGDLGPGVCRACGWVRTVDERERSGATRKKMKRHERKSRVGNNNKNFFFVLISPRRTQLLPNTWVSSGILWIITQLPSSNPFLLKLLEEWTESWERLKCTVCAFSPAWDRFIFCKHERM